MVRGEPSVKIRSVMRKGYEAEAWTRKWRWRKKKRRERVKCSNRAAKWKIYESTFARDY